MKKIYSRLLLLVILIACATPVKAQFRYAAVAGVAIDNLKFSQDLFPVNKMTGFQAGIMGEMMFPGIGFGIDFGLLYNMMGAKTDLGTHKIWSSDGFGKNTNAIHMLQIPFHLRFKWTRMGGIEDYIAPFVSGGPDFGILVGHSNIKGNPGIENPFVYSHGDLGLSVGGGFELFRRWQVGVQYTWGMGYLTKTRKLDNLAARNRQWLFRVTYFIK